MAERLSTEFAVEHAPEMLSGFEPLLLAQTAPLRTRLILRLPTSGRDLLVDVEAAIRDGGTLAG